MSKIKSKAKKFKQRSRNNPTGFQIGPELGHENFSSDGENVVDKIKSPCAEDREIGAMILANMANNQEFVSKLIEKKAIRVIAPLLVDKCFSVRHAIAGSLKNIAACNDYLVSEAMVDQDIMTCLVTLFEQYKEPWTSKTSKGNGIDSKSEIFVEACNLLWTLCENSSTAVSIFNDRNLISILLPCLTLENFNVKIPIAIAQCLQTVSENNAALTDVLLQPHIQDQLDSLVSLSSTQPEHVLLRTLAAGIKLNMYLEKFDNCMSDVTSPILQAVHAALNEPLSPMLEDLSKKIACQKAGRLDKYHEEADLEAEIDAVEKAEEAFAHLLSAKQAAIEILGNVFAVGSEDGSEYLSCSEDSEEMFMEVEGCGMASSDFKPKLSEDLNEVIINGNFWEKVEEQIILPSEEVETNLQSHPLTKDSLKRLSSVRCTALLCLNNMIPKLEVNDIGGPEKLLQLWLNTAKLLFQKTDYSDTDQVEATAHCMHAVLEKLASAGYTNQFNSMTDLDLELLINVYAACQDIKIKVHIIGSLGTIGRILCQIKAPTSAPMIKMIATFLLEACHKNTDLWLLAEIYDAIIDVFSDDDVDFIAKEIDLLENLTRLKSFFDKKFKQQRKLLGERADVIRTAKDNLRNFIKYKHDFNKK